MKRIVVIAIIAVLVAAGSGLTFMYERFDSVGNTAFYEKDSAPNVGDETLFLYNQGTTELKKAVVADKSTGSSGAKMSINEKVDMIPGPPPPTCTACPPTPTCTRTCTPTPTCTRPPTPIPQPDPLKYQEVSWGPNSKVVVNEQVTFDGTTHSIAFQQQGYGQWEVQIQGDSRVTEYANKQFAPNCQPFLPVPVWQPPASPPPPPALIDP